MCCKVDGPRNCHTKSDGGGYRLYVESKKKKKGTSELIYKTEIELQMWKTNLWLLPEGKQQGKI